MTQSIVIEGQTYKIGFRGKVYTRRDDEEWVLSLNYTREQIQEKLRAKLKPGKKSQ